MQHLWMEVEMSAKVGDVVRLKSGGPRMVVTNAAPDGHMIWVAWYDDAKNEIRRDNFPPACVES
jgi:uncharacterized protein YodC (DUF2158 family)